MTNVVVTPMWLLSGTFYTINWLPPAWCDVALCNPLFYMTDGFCFSFLGAVGIVVMVALNAPPHSSPGATC